MRYFVTDSRTVVRVLLIDANSEQEALRLAEDDNPEHLLCEVSSPPSRPAVIDPKDLISEHGFETASAIHYALNQANAARPKTNNPAEAAQNLMEKCDV